MDGVNQGLRQRRVPGRHGGGLAAVMFSIVALLLAACGPAPDASPTASGASPGVSAAPTGSPPGAASASPSAGPTGSVTIPDTPAGTRLQRVLDAIGGGEPFTVAEVGEAFAPAFLAQVPADQLITALAQVAAAGPFSVTSYTPGPDGFQAEARLEGPAATLSVDIAVEPGRPEPDRRPALQAGRRGPSASPAASWDEVDTALRELVAQPSLLAAEITGGRCAPIHALDAEPQPRHRLDVQAVRPGRAGAPGSGRHRRVGRAAGHSRRLEEPPQRDDAGRARGDDAHPRRVRDAR